MQWDEKEKNWDTQFTSNVYFWTPNSEILVKAPMYRANPWTLYLTHQGDVQ